MAGGPASGRVALGASKGGSPLELSLDALDAVAGASVAGAGRSDTRNIEALADSCKYIATAVANLSRGLPTLGPEERQCVNQLRTRLRDLILEPEDCMVGMTSAGGPGEHCGPLPDPYGVHSHEKSPSERRSRRGRSRPPSRHTTGTKDHRGSSSDDSDSDAGNSVRHHFAQAKRRVMSAHARHPEIKAEQAGGFRPQGPVLGAVPPTFLPSHPGSDYAITRDHLLQILSHLDTRSVPKPEKFDMASGQLFSDFIALFEEYCTHTFRGSTTLWVPELGRLLSGNILDAFSTLRVPGESYESIRDKLQRWCDDSQEDMDVKARKRFERYSMQPGDSLRMHAVKLERLFRGAYPMRDPERSKTLRKRYMATLPKGVAKQFSMARMVGLAVHDAELTWSKLLVVAGRMDAESGYLSTDQETDYPEVWAFTSPSRQPRQSQQFAIVGSTQLGGKQQVVSSRDPKLPARIRAGSWHSGRSGGSESGNGVGEQRSCYHCGRTGHVKANCRRFNGLCLVCGAPDHMIADCPQRRRCPGGVLSGSNRVVVGKHDNVADVRGGPVEPLPGPSSMRRVTFDASSCPTEGDVTNSALNFRAPERKGAPRRS